MLTVYDDAVIKYAQSRGESSEAVYARLDKMTGYRNRDTLGDVVLLDKLNKLKDEETTRYELPYGIKVWVNGKNGAIESALKDGMDAVKDAEVIAGIDVMESLVLAHACAGLNVGGDEYVEGLKVTIEAIQNIMGEAGPFEQLVKGE